MAEPFDTGRFRRLLRTDAFGRNLLFEREVASTMDLARDAAAAGAAEGTLALADAQTAGRGRLGRSWVTPPAANLASTLVLRPPAPVLRQVAMIAPLAIVRAVEEITGLRCDIKWPNDVQAAGKKLAGVLIETDVHDDGALVLVGAGVNVNFDPGTVDELRGIATSVQVEKGRTGDREALLAAYLLHFERLYAAARAGESARGPWRDRLVTLGQRVTATTPAGTVEGTAENVAADGALLVRTAEGTLITVEAGDVTLRA